AAVAAKYHAPVILMHNQEGTTYQSLMGDIIAFLEKSIGIAENAGVSKEHIIIDPGIGFGKTATQNLEVLKYLADLKTLGYPILVGTSRKSMIGKVLQLPEEHRVEGTAATVALAIANGADIVRVHDVAQMTLVSRMADAVVRNSTGF
ncbi:MAG TPA: dihydropteroate synthase, partial [Firmicutes bacterium]|nr:dihydropteroate synthase [Bacillota bacterium]